MAYFDCVVGGSGLSLEVTCHSAFAGLTITCTDGTTTLTKTCPSTSPYTVEFKLPNGGTWTISGAISGTTYTTTVNVPNTATLSPIPNGSTVTPINDIQTWLHCADIWDKTYTTIAQVLADGATVTALIASTNAVDYMARSTSWASSVTANSSAMTKIGANNYCANKLLANSTWCTAICNSTYFESVLTSKVPTMTSATAPSGQVIASGNYGAFYTYLAFDKSIAASSTWIVNATLPVYIGYEFTQKVCVKKMEYTNHDGYIPIAFKVQGSNDNSNWSDVYSGSSPNQTSEAKWTIIMPNNTAKYLYHRVLVSSTSVANWCACRELQFYGRA